MGKVHRIVLLTLGWEELPKAVSVYGTPPEERLREPVPGVLLQTDGGWVLLDTGFNTALVRDPALYRRFFPTPGDPPPPPRPRGPVGQRVGRGGGGLAQIPTPAGGHPPPHPPRGAEVVSG